MATLNVLVLEGDGIGPEVTGQAVRALRAAAELGALSLELEHALFGGAAIDDGGRPVSPATLELAAQADAVLLGAVGGPKWDHLPTGQRPEAGLLAIRGDLDLFANLRPAKLFEALADSCPLRPDKRHVDFVVVRELVGGLYFGKPRGVELREGRRTGFNTMLYDEIQIGRIARVALDTAGSRAGRLISVDKANVLEVQVLWREVVSELAARDYPGVRLEHMYVDNCAMQMVLDPGRFDVLVTGNLFGDILSDLAAALTGSIGMLPSASLGESAALYEPVHGSAPDIAGKGWANPLAAILSVAMLLEHSAGQPELARRVEHAVETVLERGFRTRDLGVGSGEGKVIGTVEMGDAVVGELQR